MFENLVESGSHTEDTKRRGSFMLVTLGVYGILIVAGAVIGILIGLAIPVAIQPLLPGNLRVPVSTASVLIAFAVSCSTGLFFGYLPANNAARLQPIESLRYE